MSFIACMRSLLRPFGRSFQVGGNRLMRLKSRNPFSVCYSASSVLALGEQRTWITYPWIKSDRESIIRIRSIFPREKGKMMLNPTIPTRLRRDMSNRKGLPSNTGPKRSLKNALIRSLHVKRPRIFLSSDIHPPPALIGEAGFTLSSLWFDSNRRGQSRRQWRGEVLQRQFRIGRNPCVKRRRKLSTTLEGSIAN